MSPELAGSQAATVLHGKGAQSRSACGWVALIAAILIIRVVVFLVGVLSVHTVHSLDQIRPDNATGFPWIAFDGIAYRYIFLHGYPPGPQVPFLIAYFPLFPFACRALLPIFQAFASAQTASNAAMLAFSNVCSIIGLCFTYAWTRTITDSKTAFITTLLTSLLPGAVFFSAGLTEGPFLMVVAITLYLLQKQRLYAAAMVCGVGSACRPTSVGLAVTVVLWTIYYSRNVPLGRLAARVLLIGALSVAGAASYEAFLWQQYQRIDAFKIAEDKWKEPSDSPDAVANRRMIEGTGPIWSSSSLTVTRESVEAHAKSAPAEVEPRRYSPAFFGDVLTRTSLWNRLMALALLGVMIAAACKSMAVPRVLLALPLVIFVMTYLPNGGLRASSIIRYESSAIPLFVVMAAWLSRPSRRLLLMAVGGLSLLVQAYYGFLFCRGFWIG